MGARYELGATSQRSGFRRGNQEGLMTWRDRSKLSFSLTILGLMTSCLLSRWVLLPDVTSSLSGIRVCLFELARISKIIRCFINLFYLAVQSKLVLSLTKSENGLWVLGLSGFIMGSWTFSSLTLSITSFDFLSLVSCLPAVWGSSSSFMFLLFPVSSFSLILTIWAVYLMLNSFTKGL